MKRTLSALATALTLAAWVLGMTAINAACSGSCDPHTSPHRCGQDTYTR